MITWAPGARRPLSRDCTSSRGLVSSPGLYLGHDNNDKHGDNVIMSHSLVVEAGQLGHPSDLVQAVYQEQQPTLGGNLGTRQLQSCHIMEKIISLGFS